MNGGELGMLFQCGHTLVLPCKRGAFAVNRNDHIMTPALAMYGEFAEDEFELLGKYIKPGMTVLDVGANIGTHAVAFAGMVGSAGAVLAFEPVLCNFNLLCANIAFSGHQNIIPHRAIVGNDIGTRTMLQIDQNQSANFGMVNAHEQVKISNGDGISVSELYIDSLELRACDLIKIDVEGSERLVLDGAVRTIDEYEPVIQAECNEGDTENEERLLPFFREHGYQAYWSYNRLFRPNNYKQSTKVNEGRDRNILAIKAKHSGLADGLEACQ